MSHASSSSLLALAGLLVGLSSAWAKPLVSGERIQVGGDGRGRLSLGLSSYPLGFVKLPGAKTPELFIVAGRFSHEPGLFLYEWKNAGSDDAPLLGARRAVTYPADLKQAPPPGTIFQTKSGDIFGFWILDGAIVRTRFDAGKNEFVRLDVPAIPVRGWPGTAGEARSNPDGRAVERLGVFERADGSFDVVVSVPNPTIYLTPEIKTRRDPAFFPYDGRGIWRGGLPRVFLYAGRLASADAATAELGDLRQLSATQHEALFSHGSLTTVNLGSGRERALVTGSYLGNLSYYPTRVGQNGLETGEPLLLRGPDGRALRSSYVWTSPLSVPTKSGLGEDLIVGGEGAVEFYRFLKIDADGTPVYDEPRPVRVESALLYTGSLPVLNSVDWDGDGSTDIVTGNSEGRLLFYRNHGSNASPDFREGEALKANGEEIHIQQGYAALQGPDEARWGYLSPVVVDWDGDGLPDVLASDARSQHYAWFNTGRKKAPRLTAAQPLYCDGLDMHGSWRVRPGAAQWGDRRAYVALDDDDAFHLYWQIDDVNLRDGGKLLLDDGSPITANFLAAGGTGRTKFTLVDWDGDGAMDLMVGTPRHGSVPNPKTGLPQSRGLPGASVLWLRNTGTNAAPKFAFPRVLQFRGAPVYLGQHECSLAVTDLGGPGGPHLLVGDEEGRVHYFDRKDISWSN